MFAKLHEIHKNTMQYAKNNVWYQWLLSFLILCAFLSVVLFLVAVPEVFLFLAFGTMLFMLMLLIKTILF